MKKCCLLFILLISAGLTVNAESTVRIFVKGFIDPDVRLFIDGGEVCDLNGPINQEKKVKSFVYKETVIFSYFTEALYSYCNRFVHVARSFRNLSVFSIS